MRMLFKFLACLTWLGVGLTLFSPSAEALTGSDFQAGRIIDDGKFFSGPTMSSTQIQSFLNSKVPTCDTWGTQPYGGATRAQYAASKGVSTPFICLKDHRENTPSRVADGLCNNYSGNNESAAEIIYKVSSSCGVSVQAILVLLQKEQTLVTDDWPWPVQYRSATGYGCPDTADCDAEYYGFFNQVYAAARQFKRYAKYPSEYGYQSGRNNYIKWHPDYWNNATGRWEDRCGGSTVYIQNQATAGLYNYTPFQPNATALSNIYGSQDDGCSSYGNRNFWRLFSDWFGSTTGPGYSFITATNPPDTINPNFIHSVSVTIRNESGVTWYSDGNVPSGQRPTRLRMGNYTDTPFANISDPAWLGTRNQVKMDQASVPTGSNASFTFTFRGPVGQVNEYMTWMSPVIDGVYAYPGIGMGWQTSAPAANLSYEVVGNSVPKNSAFATTYGVRLAIKNTGNAMWYSDATGQGTVTRLVTSDSLYRSSRFYDNNDPNWLTNSQVRMGSGWVAPGETGYFDFNWKSPDSGGYYPEKFTLVLDGAAIMGGTIDLSTSVTDYSYVVESVSFPTTSLSILPGDAYQLVVKLKNTGPKTWVNDSNATNGRPLRLAIKGYGKTSYSTTRDPSWITPNQLSMSESSVPAGSVGTFTATLAAPYRGVDEYMSLVPIVDGLKWLAESSELTSRKISTPVPVYWYSTTSSTINPPAQLAPGATASGKLFIKNEGNTVWRNDDNVKLAVGALRLVTASPVYRNSAFSNQDSSWIGTRNQVRMVTPIVHPGEVGEFNFSWTAPPQKGGYTEYFSLVIDGQTHLPFRGMGFYTKVD